MTAHFDAPAAMAKTSMPRLTTTNASPKGTVIALMGLVLTALALPASAQSPPGKPHGACSLAKLPATALLVHVPFEVVDGRIYVQVNANGLGPFRFAVDTGASGIGRADASLASALRLPTTGTAYSSDGVQTLAVTSTHLESLALGKLVSKDIELITRDYSSKVAKEAGFAGILGRDFFRDGLLVIDYPTKTLSFTRSYGLSPADPDVVTYQRPFRVPVTIGKLQTEANLDTGANVSFVLPARLYPRVEASGLETGSKGTLTNTVIDTRRTRLKGPVQIGSAAVSDVPARVSERFPEVLVGSAS